MRTRYCGGVGGTRIESATGRLKAIVAAVALLAVGLVLPSTGQASDGAPHPAITAMQVRMLQTELMVAALSCEAKGQYNTFVQKFSGQLAENGRQLRSHFAKTYGPKAGRRLDAFVTNLANTASSISIRNSQTFCPNLRAILRKALSEPDQRLSVLAAERAQAPAWQREPKLSATIQGALGPIR